MSDEMVEIARLVSRPEALTLQAMFDAAGIFSHVGGGWHGGTEPIPVALGGYRLTVPACQYEVASGLLREVLAEPAGDYFPAARARLLKLVLAWCGAAACVAVPFIYMASAPIWLLLAIPGQFLVTPVPAQGRGDYYLAAKPAA
jgi:hypothetical protein